MDIQIPMGGSPQSALFNLASLFLPVLQVAYVFAWLGEVRARWLVRISASGLGLALAFWLRFWLWLLTSVGFGLLVLGGCFV